MKSPKNLEHLVEVSSKFKSLKGQRCRSYENCTKLLILISIALIICHFIIAITYWLEKREKYCETDKCIRSAALFKLSMNLSVDPCQDFFEYTCGSWSKEHPLSPEYTKYSKFTDRAVRMNFAVQNFLSAKDESDDILSVRQSRMFYRSCVDKRSARMLGFTTIFEYLKKIDLPIIPRLLRNDSFANDNNTFNWMKTEAKLKTIFKMNALISVNVQRNRYNSSENLIYIGRPVLHCSISTNKKVSEKLRRVLKYVVNQIIHNVTAELISDELLEEAAEIVVNIKSSICEYGNITSSSKAPYHTSYKFQDLQDEIDLHMHNNTNRAEPHLLKSYLAYIFDDIKGVTIDYEQDLLYIKGLKDKSYILDTLRLIYTVPDMHIEFYLWWGIVIEMTRDTYLNEFLKKVSFSRRELNRKRSKRALELFCSKETTAFMHYAVAYGIVEKNYETSTGQKVKVMMKQLRDEMRHNILTADWLDGKTRLANLEKLDYMKEFIGIPDWLFQKGRLEEYYRQIEIKSTTFYRNKLQIIELQGHKHYERLRNGRENFTEFPHNTLIVNAFNMRQINSAVFPLAIFAFPMFDFGLDSLNYGSIGTLLGHELTHGFDTIGLKYDKYGNYAKWWSKDSERIFEEKSRCFVEQYNNLTSKGVKGHVSGGFTIDENIADNGGMSIAYSAYRKYETVNTQEEKLLGFENFTGSQLFFIAFGSLWCYTSTSNEAEYALKYDVHSPGYARVNVVLQNNAQFAQVFNCPEGSRMNPSIKCKIW